MDCSQSQFDLVPEYDGSYECIGYLNSTNTKYYFKCRDKPSAISDHTLNLYDSVAFMAFGSVPDFYYNLTAPNKIGIVADKLTDQIKFVVNSPFIDLDLYVNEEKECRITNDNTKWFDEITYGEFDDCVVSDDISKGIYSCSKRIEVSDGDYIARKNQYTTTSTREFY